MVNIHTVLAVCLTFFDTYRGVVYQAFLSQENNEQMLPCIIIVVVLGVVPFLLIETFHLLSDY